MRLLLDEQQSRRIAVILRGEGQDVSAISERSWPRPLSDENVLEVATPERRAVVTENARDFAVLHRSWIERGSSHFGILIAPSRRFPRRKSSPGLILTALRSLLRAHESEDAMRDQFLWLS